MTVSPGQTCVTCKRRMPHPKTESSPVSATVSIRLPADDKESITTMLADTVNREAFAGLKYPRAKALEIGLVLLNQLDEDTVAEIVRDYRGEA